nr:AAA family ATPase [Burkholderia cenocepacia]
MTLLTVIHLNGPINSGKTTIGRALGSRARTWTDATHR